MVGLWAYNAPAILEAAKSKSAVGRIKIVSFDEYAATLTAIDKGEIYATVVQDPYNFGYKSVELMAEIAKTGDKSAGDQQAAPEHRLPGGGQAGGQGPGDRQGPPGGRDFQKELNRLLGK